MAHGADGSEGAPRSLDYRPDIDGLRAVAVLAVLAYHLDAGVLPGGFIGVDVFFVISGFLITSILWREAREGRLSVAEFYRRRVLRIFPALFFLLAVVGLLGIALLTPPELADLGRSAAAASWSVANLFFYAGTDYFARDARATWLLHTWSLGVEEQFYLVLPLLVAACGPRRRRLAATVGTLAAVSFLGSTVTAFSAPAAAFYLPHSRAWELFAGSLLALGVLRVPPRRAVRETAAGTGLVLIAAACLALSKRTPFPGAGALLPCAGAVLLIGSGPETAAARLLSLRPMVFVGLISYSVYLWHWPLLVLSRHPAVELPAPLDHTAPRLAALALASLALGALSWRFVEIPLRRPRFGRNPVQVLAVAACVALAVGLGSLAVALAEGLPGRFGPEAARLADCARRQHAADNRAGRCFITSSHRPEDFDVDACLRPEGAEGGVLLLGDSHAAHLYEGLHETLGVPVLQATASGCRPTLPLRGEARCVAVLGRALAALEAGPRPRRAVIAGRWSTADADGLARLLDRLRNLGIEPWVIGHVPEYRWDLPVLLAYGAQRRDPSYAQRRRRHFEQVDALLADVAAAHGARFLSLEELLCERDRCRQTVDGVPLQWDYGHFTGAGSRYVGRILGSRLFPLAAAPSGRAPAKRRAGAGSPN